MLLRPLEHGQDVLAGQMLQVAGLLIQISALIALGRSLGLLPANRYKYLRVPGFNQILYWFPLCD